MGNEVCPRDGMLFGNKNGGRTRATTEARVKLKLPREVEDTRHNKSRINPQTRTTSVAAKGQRNGEWLLVATGPSRRAMKMFWNQTVVDNPVNILKPGEPYTFMLCGLYAVWIVFFKKNIGITGPP